ncbi:glycoside hydrolase family 28 protein [Suillus plorans]|uniref:endo-polygalacturonase n=1 Tax=Suillus plorans TaxID=116603 RepID=A0A9P7AMM5_9AGAM|nr:glycoside hydrolase family 28 protein [Suillus plorans]KAG1792354.1 glycoside hydrolase family 28 protein [Suillus plorans]
MFLSLALGFLVSGITAVAAASSSGCVGTISSLDDVSSATQCTTVNINAFTVPGGKTFELQLLDGTTVNIFWKFELGRPPIPGDVSADTTTSSGSENLIKAVLTGEMTLLSMETTIGGMAEDLFTGKLISYCGTAFLFNLASARISISGTLNDVYVVNSPAHVFSITNPGPLTISGATVDNLQGNYPSSRSGNAAAAHNTDGFDVNSSDILIQNCTVLNQDDCLAIKRGTNITFADNYCEYGHGISIGSISSNTVVSDIEIIGNHVVSSAYSFRIKTDTSATNSVVKNVTYSDNTATNCTSFGVLITQSYPSNLGTPGNGATISDINFNHGTTSLTANKGAYMVAVNCGSGSCTGDWDWSGLQTSGGKAGSIINNNLITGFVDTQ